MREAWREAVVEGLGGKQGGKQGDREEGNWREGGRQVREAGREAVIDWLMTLAGSALRP